MQYKKYGRSGFLFADIIERGHVYEIGYPRCLCPMVEAGLASALAHCECSQQSMFNLEIIKKSGFYEVEEGCLSLDGTRTTKRWKSVKVQYQNRDFQIWHKTFTGFTAQIIQHEIDYCDGIII